MRRELEPVLRLFAERLREHLPGSEAGVREVIAQSCRDALGPSAAGVVVEAPLQGKRLDVWITEPPVAIELLGVKAVL